MATYNDLRNTKLPSLAEMVARMRAQRQQREKQPDNPGETPADAVGQQGQVQIPGEAPIQAQPVAGQRPQYDVRVGMPQAQQPPPAQNFTMPPMRVQVPAQQQGQPVNPQASMDPRAAQLRALMSQGLTYGQAMRRIQQGG